MMDKERFDKKTPFFMSIEEGVAKIRWKTLITWVSVVIGVHILTVFCLSQFLSNGRGFLSQFGFVLFTFSGMLLAVLYIQYRRFVVGYQQIPNKQFSLLMIFLATACVAIWITALRLEHRTTQAIHRDRQTLEKEATAIVEKGKVRFSGNQNVLMVVVNRRDFGDADLADLLMLIQSRLEGRVGVEHLLISDTAVTDESAQLLAKCKFLKYLSLDGNSITDVSLEQFAAIDSLEMISLAKTQVTQAGLDRLRKLRPGVDVSPLKVIPTNRP